jgi:hypothetical protein
VAGPSERAEDLRPPRPTLVELASAMLVIGSGIDAAISFEGMSVATTPESRLLSAATVAVGFALIALGLLIRSGRVWLLTINVVAVAAFLELLTLTFGGIFAALLYMVVLGILLREQWWFRWSPPAPPPEPAVALAGDDRRPWG